MRACECAHAHAVAQNFHMLPLCLSASQLIGNSHCLTAPCWSAAGHSPECYRLFEALESGSIPVVVDHPGTFRPRCGDPWRELRASGLVAFLRSWDALPAFMEGVVRDPAPAHTQQRAVTAGFAALKDRLYRPLMDALLA